MADRGLLMSMSTSISFIKWQLEPWHISSYFRVSLSELVYLWFLSSMAVGDMTLPTVSFFYVIGWSNKFSIRSVNGSWRIESSLCSFLINCSSRSWSNGTYRHLLLSLSEDIQLWFLRSTTVWDTFLASISFLSVIGLTDPLRIRTVNGSWKLDSCLFALLCDWYNRRWRNGTYLRIFCVIDKYIHLRFYPLMAAECITFTSVPFLIVDGQTDSFSIRFDNGSWGLEPCHFF